MHFRSTCSHDCVLDSSYFSAILKQTKKQVDPDGEFLDHCTAKHQGIYRAPAWIRG
jgi:hypothetical protein